MASDLKALLCDLPLAAQRINGNESIGNISFIQKLTDGVQLVALDGHGAYREVKLKMRGIGRYDVRPSVRAGLLDATHSLAIDADLPRLFVPPK